MNSINHSANFRSGLANDVKSSIVFDEAEVLHELKHYLPAQGPLKDFVHHNTLHAFQNLKFFDALHRASEIFGYRVSFSLREYRALHQSAKINDDIINRVIERSKGPGSVENWKPKMVSEHYHSSRIPRIGQLRANWKRHYRIDMDSLVHPTLFRVICSYLDQGIALWNFPDTPAGLLDSIRELERNSFSSFFRSKRAKKILLDGKRSIRGLLDLLVKDRSLYKHYLFDQQFAHQGWSGIVANVEDNPNALLDSKRISLHDIIYFELLLEIDALDSTFGEIWSPLSLKIKAKPVDLFAPVVRNELDDVLSLWQEAFEWTYYDQVLSAIGSPKPVNFDTTPKSKSFQVVVCVDDRGFSFRHYLERIDRQCETFGSPGFFNVEFFFQPINGKFYTKLCPANVTPKYLIKEVGSIEVVDRDVHLAKHSHTLFRGWLVTQTLGFISALRLIKNIFMPAASAVTSSSFAHMNKVAELTIENKNVEDKENGLQIGFTVAEMAERVEGLLRSIGLVHDFAPIIYIIGHGSSSVNNPHYAAYDCGACAGRPGSVNARVMCYMANHPEVRSILANGGLLIPETTKFVGALHDTTRDEIEFFDENSLNESLKILHKSNIEVFHKALDANSKERSRRFAFVNTRKPAEAVHEKVKLRSVSLFEPRPELNHATNAVCVFGHRDLTKHLFLDRRAFLNSYDYTLDPEGKQLLRAITPIGPVCGGINLEYFFSRVDNQKMGAGSKLPHNVMGLFGVANGIEGDLRPGLPIQMTEVHDPVRLLLIVHHYRRVVLNTIRQSVDVYEWYANNWINLVVFDPMDQKLYRFLEGEFIEYHPLQHVPTIDNVVSLIEAESPNENIPPHIINPS
jgi:uncharacterized protein YbcC (UPF0753/DUF2309 family)